MRTPQNLGLLRREPHFRRLFAARAVSELGSWLAYVALSIQIYRLTGSATWVGALLVVELLPTVFVALTLAPLVDRLPRRRVLVGADLVNFAVFAALPFVAGPAAIVALAAVAGVALAFFRPAVRAAAPNLVPGDDLARANSLVTLAETAALGLGPLAGGLLAAAGIEAAFALNAASFLVSALLVVRIPHERLQAARAASAGHLQDLRDGLRAIARSRDVLVVAVSWSAATCAMGATNATEILIAKDVFHRGDLGFGVLASLCGVGLILGSLAAPRLLERTTPIRVYTGGLALLGLAFGCVSVAPSFALVLVATVAGTAGNGLACVGRALLVQHGVEDALRGRVFMLLMGSSSTLTASGMLVAGLAVSVVGARGVWALAALAVAAAVASALALRPRAARGPALAALQGR